MNPPTTNMTLFDFIASCPSPFHTVQTLRDILSEAGYEELREYTGWPLRPGGMYFVTRNQSSLIAFRLPKKPVPTGFQMCAAHGDSPTFQIKENPEKESAGMYVQLHTERYGGMLCASWLDRPLSAAGRVIVKNGNTLSSRLVKLDRDLAVIPSVAIHMNRNANENMSYNANVDMFPLIGSLAAKGKYRALLAAELGVEEADIVSADMSLYNRAAGVTFGAENEFICAPRLDDLQCVFASLTGFLSAHQSTSAPVLAVLDNEEVGSQTKQGAAGTFLSDTLHRICEEIDIDYRITLCGSFLVSADNAHAVHPNHPEYADSMHKCAMNGGVVIKRNANQRYTTDAVSEGIFATICKKADVPVQYFANRSDLAGGSTLGNIANTHVSLNTVDIGLAQLAMHSATETAGALDTDYLVRAMVEYYSSAILPTADGWEIR